MVVEPQPRRAAGRPSQMGGVWRSVTLAPPASKNNGRHVGLREVVSGGASRKGGDAKGRAAWTTGENLSRRRGWLGYNPA